MMLLRKQLQLLIHEVEAGPPSTEKGQGGVDTAENNQGLEPLTAD